MSTIERNLSGQALLFPLGGDLSEYIDTELLASAGRSARTLIKDGPVRVTLVALAAGGELGVHRAPGRITVHVVSGRIRFQAEREEWDLELGDLLSLGAGVEHGVKSSEGGVFLLTVVTGAAA